MGAAAKKQSGGKRTDKIALVKVEGVKCPEFRVSYPHLFKTHQFEGQNEAQYGLVMLFDKSTDISELKRAAKNAAKEKWGADQSKWPKLRTPFRDGDKEKPDVEGYEGCIFVTAKSKTKPQLIDQKKERIEEDDERFGAGVYCRASLIAFAYDQKGNKGVSFSLQNVQLLRDGDRFSGRRAAEDEFDSVDDAVDDDDGLGGGDEEENDDL